jgi:hypothetical protein
LLASALLVKSVSRNGNTDYYRAGVSLLYRLGYKSSINIFLILKR